ncbi:MAG: DUF1569 domain-containing protein [Rhodothermales bacterium]
MNVSFDVNDASLRHEFINDQMLEVLNRLDEDTPALWGRMSAQHMLEHLIWTFNVSIGRAAGRCDFTKARQRIMKQFIYTNMATPHQFENPLLPAHPLPMEFADINAAKLALSKAVTAFSSYYLANPEAEHIHPLFGRLGREDWERVHYKHCFHHLSQFGLISQDAHI